MCVYVSTYIYVHTQIVSQWDWLSSISGTDGQRTKTLSDAQEGSEKCTYYDTNLFSPPREWRWRRTESLQRRRGRKMWKQQERSEGPRTQKVNPPWVAIRGSTKASSGNRGALPSKNMRTVAGVLHVSWGFCILVQYSFHHMLISHVLSAWMHKCFNIQGIQTVIILYRVYLCI